MDDAGDVPDAVRALAAAVDDLLGDRRIGTYLYGSAVDGGLRPGSDLDLLVVVDRSLADAERHGLVAHLVRVSGPAAPAGPARGVELTVLVRADVVPWRYPPRVDLQYGDWLRPGLAAGELPRPHESADAAVLVTQVRSRGVPLAGPPASAVLAAVPAADLRRAAVDSLPALVADLVGDERNVVLTLARMWTTLQTGRIVPKDAAAEHVRGQVDGSTAALLDLAAAAYRGEVDDRWGEHGPALASFVAQATTAVRRLAQP